MLSFDQLPLLTKAAVQEIRDMYRGGFDRKRSNDNETVRYKAWDSAYNRCNDKKIMDSGTDIHFIVPAGIVLAARWSSPPDTKSVVWWCIVIKEFKLLTPEIVEELTPYLLAGNNG